MSLAGMNPSKHTADDSEFLDGLLPRQLIAFKNHIYAPGYLIPNATKFLDNEWIEISTLQKFLAQDASCIELVAFAAGISLPSTDHELLHSLLARQLIAFHEYVSSSNPMRRDSWISSGLKFRS
ncbi:hypothetical protein B0H13DRAFT_2369085 [Mycena leptocephala]|nr:hypothetical protein B0H13DRAFT_2369085 [Mycena leptocephala]